MDKNKHDIIDRHVRIDIEQLDRYASGGLTAEEAAAMESILLNSSTHAEIFHSLKELTAGGASISQVADVQAGWEKVRIATQGYAYSQQQSPSSIRTAKRYFQIGSLICGLILAWVIRESSIQLPPFENGTVIYTTRHGERATFTMIDGTQVSLNSDSRVEIPGNYGASYRTVQLEGHAYFHVITQASTPYIVEAAGVRTKVLGTKFSIRAYNNSPVRVSVVSGRVAVNDTIVNPNQSAYYENTGRITVRNQILNPNDIAFASGKLVLNDVKLGEAVEDINNWYGIDIKFADSEIENYHIRGTFYAGDAASLKEILETMFGVNVHVNGRTVTLSLQ